MAPGFEVEEERLFPAEGPGSAELRILSTTDLVHFVPLIEAFQKENSGVAVLYTVASSTEAFKAVTVDGAHFDLVISSAMDLQMKLANDGFSQGYRSSVTDTLPDWAKWRDEVFAFTQEPAVVVVSKAALGGLPAPETRQELIAMLRDHPDLFDGKIGTYDLRTSGVGYLFATQDARQSDAFWRLAEVMGTLHPRLYCCSGQMIDDLQAGRIALAYNVMGSYADAQLKDDSDGTVIALTDFTNVLLRSAAIPSHADAPVLAGAFLDFLLGPRGRLLMQATGALPPLDATVLSAQTNQRPIRLDPGLLVYLDSLKRKSFLREWTAALLQN